MQNFTSTIYMFIFPLKTWSTKLIKVNRRVYILSFTAETTDLVPSDDLSSSLKWWAIFYLHVHLNPNDINRKIRRRGTARVNS